jgi:glycosyltransferase involved in cell wall biosynthesis
VRIVHLCSSLSVEAGGVSRAVIDAAMVLTQHGVRIDLVSFKRGTLDFPWGDRLPENLTLTFLAPSALASAELKAHLAAALPGADALHLHGMWEPMTAAAAKIARRLKVPYICTIHGMLDPWSVRQRHLKKRLYYEVIERKRLSQASAIHLTAAEEARKSAPWLPPGVPQVIIPYIVDLEPYRELPERERAHALFPTVPPDAPWILFLSRIHEKKGLDLLLESIPLLPEKRAQLVIAGTGATQYVQQLKDRAAALRISDRVHFVGLVKGPSKTALYRRADMLALPTSQENFGLVFPEALACETPVLITEDVDISKDIIEAGAGLLIIRDPQQIAQQITAMLSDPAAARQRGVAGRKWVFSTLDSGRIAELWKEAYASLRRPG